MKKLKIDLVRIQKIFKMNEFIEYHVTNEINKLQVFSIQVDVTMDMSGLPVFLKNKIYQFLKCIF